MAVAALSDTVSFTASASATKTITHNIGRVPVCALALPAVAAGQFLNSALIAGSLTTTQATFQFTAGSAITATFTFYWLVIG
jgi:hypothetical protein